MWLVMSKLKNVHFRVIIIAAIVSTVFYAPVLSKCFNVTQQLHELSDIVDNIVEHKHDFKDQIIENSDIISSIVDFKTQVIDNMLTLKNEVVKKANDLKITIADTQPNCVQIQCKFVCLNGKISNVADDIRSVANTTVTCDTIEELRLYNYEFPDNRISQGFLEEFSSIVENLYIASSYVTDIEGGAFANGIYRSISFENLFLEVMEKNFFEGISSNFESLAIMQRVTPLPIVCSDFLDYVKYQIKALTLQVGIECVRNVSASGNLLSNLGYVDFSYNDLRDHLTDSTFSKLSMVEHLDLSHSNISYLADYIFASMTDTLEYLDISYNHLTTISSTIFGWHEISHSLRIYATDNDWHCSCYLYEQMKTIFAYQTTRKMYCVTPDEYAYWSVFDTRLCSDYANSPIESAITTTSCPTCGALVTTLAPMISSIASTLLTANPAFPASSTTTPLTTSTTTLSMTTTAKSTTLNEFLPDLTDNNNVQLVCRSSSNSNGEGTKHWIQSPTLEFDMSAHTNDVDVILRSDEYLNDSYGLIWFSKVTKYYYKMEINYNEYGLGCYGSISLITTVEDLLPGESYTFCLVIRDQQTVSPFNCKSIYINGNFDVSYNAWLTQDSRVAGISLIVFGIVLWTFIGILSVFVVLKKKPTLLKGSKRVGTTKGSPTDIVVFPKDKTLVDFKLKEEMLAKRASKSTISYHIRRDSVASNVSNGSYMNANLYEVIPAYLQFGDQLPTTQGELPLHFNTEVPFYDYMPPLSTTASDVNLVSYAEIPYRTKRTSDDPLPEVPHDQAPLSLPLSECGEMEQTPNYGTTMDSQV